MVNRRWRELAEASGVAFAGFSAAHLIDEFMWSAPAEFHLAESATELLALAYMLAVVGLLVQAVRGRRGGFLGLAIGGGLILLADLLKHGGEIAAPGPWRYGPISVLLAVGLSISSLLMAWASIQWLRTTPQGSATPTRG